MATLLAGGATGAGMGVILTGVVDDVKTAAAYEEECEALQEAVDQIKPYAEKIEVQLHMRAENNLPPLNAQREWLERLKNKIVDAQIELHSYNSAHPHVSRINLVRNRSLAKKIGKLTNEIRRMAGNPAVQAIHSLEIETNNLLSGYIHQQTQQHGWPGSQFQGSSQHGYQQHTHQHGWSGSQFQDSNQHDYQQQTHQHGWSGSQFQGSNHHDYQQQTHQHGWSGSQFQDSSQHDYQQQYGQYGSSDSRSQHSSPASWHDTTGSPSSASGWSSPAHGSHDAWNYSRFR